MLVSNLLKYLKREGDKLDITDSSSYESYIVPDDISIQVAQYGTLNLKFHTVTYVQILNPVDKNDNIIPGPLQMFCQLEGLPDDPIQFNMDSDEQIKVFDQIAKERMPFCPHCATQIELPNHILANVDIYDAARTIAAPCCNKGIRISRNTNVNIYAAHGPNREDDWGDTIVESSYKD